MIILKLRGHAICYMMYDGLIFLYIKNIYNLSYKLDQIYKMTYSNYMTKKIIIGNESN